MATAASLALKDAWGDTAQRCMANTVTMQCMALFDHRTEQLPEVGGRDKN